MPQVRRRGRASRPAEQAGPADRATSLRRWNKATRHAWIGPWCVSHGLVPPTNGALRFPSRSRRIVDPSRCGLLSPGSCEDTLGQIAAVCGTPPRGLVARTDFVPYWLFA
jgi:hypothetical protein